MARISSFKCVQNKREKGIVHIIKRKNEIEEKREEHVVSAIINIMRLTQVLLYSKFAT